ncbi:MAG: NADH-quinone oxidoreductase subunit J [Actinomycetota bacterium]
MHADLILFWVFAPVSVGSAIAMLFQHNAIHAALFLIVNFFTLAVFYLVLGAPFLFAVQIIVYAGAIMVLFLFVIMLLGVDREESLIEQLRGQRPLAILLGLGFVAEMIVAIRAGVGFSSTGAAHFDTVANRGGNPQALSNVLFRQFFFPFEVTSVLLIVAAIAAMTLAQRQRTAVTSAELGATPDGDGNGAGGGGRPADPDLEEEPVG